MSVGDWWTENDPNKNESTEAMEPMEIDDTIENTSFPSIDNIEEWWDPDKQSKMESKLKLPKKEKSKSKVRIGKGENRRTIEYSNQTWNDLVSSQQFTVDSKSDDSDSHSDDESDSNSESDSNAISDDEVDNSDESSVQPLSGFAMSDDSKIDTNMDQTFIESDSEQTNLPSFATMHNSDNIRIRNQVTKSLLKPGKSPFDIWEDSASHFSEMKSDGWNDKNWTLIGTFEENRRKSIFDNNGKCVLRRSDDNNIFYKTETMNAVRHNASFKNKEFLRVCRAHKKWCDRKTTENQLELQRKQDSKHNWKRNQRPNKRKFDSINE